MSYSYRRTLGICFLSCLVTGSLVIAGDGDRRSDNEQLYSGSQYIGWIEYLASNELEGRGTGQVGIDKAGDYIADVWKSFGVEPAGDDDTFFQNFQLPLDSRIGSLTRLAFATNGRLTRKPAKLNEEYVPLPFSSSESFSGDVVFAGYGISSPDENYDDYKGIDVESKVVLILRRGPGFGDFGMGEISFRAKSRAAANHKAAAVLIVNRDGDAKLYDFKAGGGRGGDHGIPMMHITPDLATRLLKAGGLPDIQTLQDRIESSRSPASAPLEGVSVRGRVEIEPIMTDVRNVVGKIPGTGPQADEIIVIGAHYDHLGVRNKDKSDFNPEKDISNGADDNASGTAMLMQLARVFTEGGRPNRTIVMVAFTAEELGLLGSRHFAKNPTVDLNKCIAMLNFDMVGRLNNDLLEVGGMKTGSGFEELVNTLGEQYGFDIRDGGGGRGPSDHTNFYQRDIPVMFFFTGIHKQYHRPEDDTHLINLDGAMRIAHFVTDILASIDTNPEAPKFAKDTRRARIGRQEAPKKRDETKTTKPEQIAKATPMRNAPLAGPRSTRHRAPPARANEPVGGPVRLGVVAASDDGDGVLVADIDDGSPADQAGLRPGDRIVRVGDRAVKTLDDAVDALAKFGWGDRTTVRIQRGGNSFDMAVRFGEIADLQGNNSRTQAGLDHTLIDRLVRILTQRDADGALNSFGLTSTPESFEITAVVEQPHGSSGFLTGLVDEIAKLIDTDAQRNGVAYRYQLNIATQNANGGKRSLSVTIRVSMGTDTEAAMTHVTSPHINGAHSASAATVHDGGAGETGGHAVAHGRAPTGRSPHGVHDDVPSDVENNTMPPVRLGIMPTYGASEGEGFEIAGVVDGGAAAKGGMKDDDRILSIGGRDVTDVYSYMDALRNCKPGQEIPVVVLRDGKRVELTITTAPPETKEAA